MDDNRKSALITSAQIIIERHEKREACIVEWDMPSWNFKEYETACNDAKFYNQVEQFLPPCCSNEDGNPPPTLHERLLTKYYLAGTSARWFLGTPFDVLAAEIDNQLSKVRDKTMLLSDVSSEKCDGAVGHLRMVNEDGKVF